METNFSIFATVSDENLAVIYKDILRSREEGLRQRQLDPYARQLMEICHYDMIGQASDFAKELFFDEVAKRYF